MNAIDYIILGILVISTGISFLRGFVREVLSLVAWILSMWVAVSFTPQASVLIESQISNESIRLVVAFLGLFIATLVAGSLTNALIGQLVKKTGLSGTDRMVGLIFGLARGGVIVSVIVLVIGITEIPKEPWWQESVMLNHFETMAGWMKGNFPEGFPQNLPQSLPEKMGVSTQFVSDGLPF